MGGSPDGAVGERGGVRGGHLGSALGVRRDMGPRLLGGDRDGPPRRWLPGVPARDVSGIRRGGSRMSDGVRENRIVQYLQDIRTRVGDGKMSVFEALTAVWISAY